MCNMIVRSDRSASVKVQLPWAFALSCLLFGGVCAPTAKAGLVVAIEQVSSQTPTPGQQTLITAAVKVSGTLAQPLTTSAFSTVLSWSASGVGVTNADLYTVNSAGSKVSNSTSMVVSTPGFLYANSNPLADMNTTGLNSANQRYVNVSGDSGFPTLSGTFSGVTIANVQFALSPNISNASFSFTISGNLPQYGFADQNFNMAQSFSSGGGTLTVVPEPQIFGVLCAGVFLLGLVREIRRQKK